MNVRVTTGPWPETPVAPGGRMAVICSVPSSSRWVTVTICPSCDSSDPFETFTTCNNLGSYESCSGTVCTFCAPFSSTFTVKVDPAGCVEAGGSKAKLACPDPLSVNCGIGGAVAAGAGCGIATDPAPAPGRGFQTDSWYLGSPACRPSGWLRLRVGVLHSKFSFAR